ncbi:fibronectin type III domain-containing protein [Actinomadura sp. 9N407]|uniref:fibronectin type III domain-containing protein n=1 Tax=Actinomadura sp. 9N407 TaxID=3375154 RepID=UPI0037B67EBA
MGQAGIRGTVRALFRRDRVTGQVAIGLVGILVVTAAVYGVGVASAKYDLADVGAWLSAPDKGMVVHANGPAAKVDGKAALPGAMRGHRIKVVQDGSTVLIVDLDSGVVSRIDPSQLKIEQNRRLGTAGLQVLVGQGRAYTVDAVRGTIQQIDPFTLAAWGKPATVAPPLGQAGIDAKGTLWVPAPQHGQVIPFRDGAAQAPVGVGKPGDRLALTIAAGEPVAIDSTAATATVIKETGAHLTVTLPSTVRKAGKGGVLAPARTEGRTVPLLVPETGSLLLLDTGTGRHTSGALSMSRHRYGAPQILGSKVYIPDETAGALVVYNTATRRFERFITVTGKPSALEVFVKDGLLWAHDPNDHRAVVLDDRGSVKRVEKYDDKVAGGPNRRPLPAPRGNGNGSGGADQGGGRGGSEQGPQPQPQPQPQPTRTPLPQEPPLAPTNLTVTPGSGTMQVDFQPSTGGTPTGYVLKDVPAGVTVSPQSIAPNAGAYTFTVSGGQCSQEYRFRVAVQYKDAQGRAGEQVSQPSDPVRPCVPPGAPSNVSAKAVATGAQVTWNQAAGGAPGTTYTVAWSGKSNGSRSNVTGTSVTLGQISANGRYTFTVTAANDAGTGNAASTSAQLTGPTQSYKVTSNGNSTAYIHKSANANNDNDVVATMRDNNGESVPVLCQTTGTKYTHPNDKNLSGNMYLRMTYSGDTGYIIGYLIDTNSNWKSYKGLPLWRC